MPSARSRRPLSLPLATRVALLVECDGSSPSRTFLFAPEAAHAGRVLCRTLSRTGNENGLPDIPTALSAVAERVCGLCGS